MNSDAIFSSNSLANFANLSLQKPEEMRIFFDVEKKYIGKVLGRGGATIQSIQAVSGTRVQIDQSVDPARVQVEGDEVGIQCTKCIILDIAASQFKGFAFLRQAGQFVERVSVDPMQSDVCPPSAVYVYGRGYTPYEQISDIRPSIGYHPPKVQSALHTFYQLRPQTLQNAREYEKHKTLGGMQNSPSAITPIPPLLTANASALPHQLLGGLNNTPTSNYSQFQSILTSAAPDTAAINQSLRQQTHIDNLTEVLQTLNAHKKLKNYAGLNNSLSCCLSPSSSNLDNNNNNNGGINWNGGTPFLLDRFSSADLQSVESSSSMVSPLQAHDQLLLSRELKLNLLNQRKNNANMMLGGLNGKQQQPQQEILGGLYGLDVAQIEGESMYRKFFSQVVSEQQNESKN